MTCPTTFRQSGIIGQNNYQIYPPVCILGCYRLQEKPTGYELHVFQCYVGRFRCVCVYSGCVSNNLYQLNLLIAKSRVAALRQLSIPRLKLKGAVLAVRLTDTVVSEVDLNHTNVTYCCDSQTVLQSIG